MSINELVYERTTVPANGGILTPDEYGYYSVNAGAYGVMNESGMMYSSENMEKLFEDDSVLKRTIGKGVLYSELGHPEYIPGMNLAMFEARASRVQEDRFCGHIRKASLIKNKDGYTYITRIEIKPQGHYKSTLQDSFDNSLSNAFFSVRSCSNRRRVNGVLVKFVYKIITWDFVTEGGISLANKFDTVPNLDMESMDSYSISKLIKNDEIISVDLDNTSEVSYTLKHFEEYKKSNKLDLESTQNMDMIEGILKRALYTSRGDDIFKWK